MNTLEGGFYWIAGQKFPLFFCCRRLRTTRDNATKKPVLLKSQRLGKSRTMVSNPGRPRAEKRQTRVQVVVTWNEHWTISLGMFHSMDSHSFNLNVQFSRHFFTAGLMEVGLFIHEAWASLQIIYNSCLLHALLATWGTSPGAVSAFCRSELYEQPELRNLKDLCGWLPVNRLRWRNPEKGCYGKKYIYILHFFHYNIIGCYLVPL